MHCENLRFVQDFYLIPCITKNSVHNSVHRLDSWGRHDVGPTGAGCGSFEGMGSASEKAEANFLLERAISARSRNSHEANSPYR
jgi:hypothetical protein